MACNLFKKAKFNLVDRKKNAPKVVLKDVDSGKVFDSIRSAVGTECKLYLSDRLYQLASVQDVERLLSMDDTDKYQYVSEHFDCDNYAYRLMGNFNIPEWSSLAFGICWTGTPNGGHAVNCFVDNELRFWIIEPQNDQVFELPSDWKPFVIFM